MIVSIYSIAKNIGKLFQCNCELLIMLICFVVKSHFLVISKYTNNQLNNWFKLMTVFYLDQFHNIWSLTRSYFVADQSGRNYWVHIMILCQWNKMIFELKKKCLLFNPRVDLILIDKVYHHYNPTGRPVWGVVNF